MRMLHVGLRVEDLERSLEYYTNLGYETVGSVPDTEYGTLTMMALPGDEFVSLELVHQANSGPIDPGGLNHLVIQTDDLHATVTRLAGLGIAAERPVSPTGSDDFWTSLLTDPDGYRIELVQWPAGHADGMTRADFP
jgi:lactoylglutathione lyase